MLIYRINEIVLVRMAGLYAGKRLLSALLKEEVVYIPGLLGRIRIDKGLYRIKLGRDIWLDVLHRKAYLDLFCRVLILPEYMNSTETSLLNARILSIFAPPSTVIR